MLPASQVLAATTGAMPPPPQLSGHLKSGEDPGLPRPASRQCSEPCGLNGHNCGVGGPRWSECPHMPLLLPWSWLLAWTEGSIQMWVGIQGRWEGHRLLFVILLD